MPGPALHELLVLVPWVPELEQPGVLPDVRLAVVCRSRERVPETFVVEEHIAAGLMEEGSSQEAYRRQEAVGTRAAGLLLAVVDNVEPGLGSRCLAEL